MVSLLKAKADEEKAKVAEAEGPMQTASWGGLGFLGFWRPKASQKPKERPKPRRRRRPRPKLRLRPRLRPRPRAKLRLRPRLRPEPQRPFWRTGPPQRIVYAVYA